jgi:hypothetical protein
MPTISQYVAYQNEQRAKPLNWKFTGFNTQQPIASK